MNNEQMTNRAVKTKARICMRGNYERASLMVLLYGGIRLLFLFVPSLVFPHGEPVFITVMTLIITYLLQVVASMFMVGISKAALSISREKPFSFKDIAYGFVWQSNKFVLLEMLLIGISTLIQLPAIIINAFFGLGFIEYYAIAISAAFISTLLTIRIRFALYVIMDEPQLLLSEALKKSIAITHGSFLKVLKLDLSFIPMHLLAISSFAFGYLLVLPYIETANAIMFDELSSH